MEEYTIVNLFGDIFKFIGNIFKFGFNIIKGYCVFTAKSVDFIASIFGINNFGIKIIISIIFTSILSLIPDFITYYGCRISNKYRKLETEQQKKEYISKHTHFLLRIILEIKSKKRFKQAYAICSNKTEGNMPKDYNSVDTGKLANKIELYNDEQEEILFEDEIKPVQTEEYTNVKLVKGENVVGNMMRNGVVLERRFSASNKPMLIKFENVPTELYTNHLLNRNSGVRYKNKNIELNFDDPEFLKRTDLYENLTIEQLKLLKEQIEQDKNYKLGLSSFFTINDKVMSLSKKM